LEETIIEDMITKILKLKQPIRFSKELNLNFLNLKKKLKEIPQPTLPILTQLMVVLARTKDISLNTLMVQDLFSESQEPDPLELQSGFILKNTVLTQIRMLLKLLRKFQIEH
jgi:hypothetical protein